MHPLQHTPVHNNKTHILSAIDWGTYTIGGYGRAVYAHDPRNSDWGLVRKLVVCACEWLYLQLLMSRVCRLLCVGTRSASRFVHQPGLGVID